MRPRLITDMMIEGKTIAGEQYLSMKSLQLWLLKQAKYQTAPDVVDTLEGIEAWLATATAEEAT